MAQRRRFGAMVAMLLLASLGAAVAPAQAAAPRVSGDWRSSPAVTLSGSLAPSGISGLDQGAAPANRNLGRMLLLLAPSVAQQQALAAELAALQNPVSPQYHQWLTSSAFAGAYANSPSDVAAVAAWLQSQGFTVAPIPAGRGWIEFSGTVAQVERAFQAQIHMIAGASEVARPVLIGNISVPAALKPVVSGLVSLDGVVSASAFTVPVPVVTPVAELAAATSPSAAEALTPQLEAQLLDLDPLISAGLTGAGQSIAIAARSNVNVADVAAFRSNFGLPASPLTVALNGADPGLTDAQAGATFEASWAGAAAPGAQIVLVPAASTEATDGVDLSLAAIVDRQLAGTAVVGYSACEAGMSPAHQAFYAALYQQAAAEGIAIVSAAGDSGSAACALPGANTPVSSGYGVNALASTPWNTAVGVAGFSASASGLAAWSPRNPADPAYAGGGGSSALYSLPFWQSTPVQLPPTAGGALKRFLPDLSLPTAIDSSGNPGLAFCLGNSNSGAGCTLVRSGGSGAAASLFAGITALIAQKHGAQGNVASGLYALATRSGVYTDVAQGSAQLKCVAGSPGCSAEGQIGFSAAAGYDLATGLGVPDAQALVNAFASPQVTGTGGTSVTLSLSPQQNDYNLTASVTLSATVTSQTGGATPTGTVTFYDSTTNLGTATLYSGYASITPGGPWAAGSHTLTVQYSGDSNYAANNNSNAEYPWFQTSGTSLAVTSYPSSATPGQNISPVVTLTVGSPGAGSVIPSGAVTLTVSGGATATCSVSSSMTGGVITYSCPAVIPSSPTSGNHTLQANFAGDANYTTSTSGGVTVNISSGISTTTANSVSTTSPALGASVTVNTTITPSSYGSANPGGSVSYTLDGSAVGTPATVTPGAPSTSTITFTASTAGNHTLLATYSGDSIYASSSASVTLSVGKIGTTLSLNPASTSASVGTSLPVSAAVTPSGSNSAAPSGTIAFTLDGAQVASGSLPGTSPDTANASFVVLSAGSHALAASYGGDNSYAGSTAGPVTINVSKGATTTTVTASPAIVVGGTPETLTATIAPPNPAMGATYTFTGSVVFYDGAKLLGQVTVSGNAAALSGVTLASSASHSITAVYSGDGNWLTSTSAVVALAATALPDTVALTANTTSPGPGQAVILTVTVTPAAAPGTGLAPNPTGTVIFYSGSTVLGSATLAAQSPTLSSSATFTTQLLPAGNDSVSAYYQGDSNYDAAMSNTLSLAVESFTIAPSATNPPTNLNIVQGGAGSVSFDVTGSGGFNGLIQLECQVPTQDNMTCTASPQQVTPPGTVTFAVQTFTAGTMAQRETAPPLWPHAAGGAALAGLIFFLLPFGRRARTFLRAGPRGLFIVLLLFAGIVCTGVGCTSNTNLVSSSGTPLGVATLKVTGQAYVDNTTVSQSLYFTVNVTAQ